MLLGTLPWPGKAWELPLTSLHWLCCSHSLLLDSARSNVIWLGSLARSLRLAIPAPLFPQTPHDNVSPSPAIVVPVRVEAAPALVIPRVFEHSVHDGLKVFEEDEVLEPGSADIVTPSIDVGRYAGLRSLEHTLAVCHVGVDPAAGVHVEDVCFVEVFGSVFAGDVDGRLAG